jgi:hypothetical protein
MREEYRVDPTRLWLRSEPDLAEGVVVTLLGHRL